MRTYGKREYKCKECGTVKELGSWGEISHIHLFTPSKKGKIYLKCPKCNKMNWFVRIDK